MEHLFYQFQYSSVGDFLLNACHQPFLRYAVKVAFQIRVDHPVIAALKQFIHSAQRILTAFARSEPVALRGKVAFKDRFHYLEQCSLNDSIAESWHSYRTLLFAPRFGYPYPLDRLRLVLIGL